jgi:hypothetical protein
MSAPLTVIEIGAVVMKVVPAVVYVQRSYETKNKHVLKANEKNALWRWNTVSCGTIKDEHRAISLSTAPECSCHHTSTPRNDVVVPPKP